jgi:hypothetical protein
MLNLLRHRKCCISRVGVDGLSGRDVRSMAEISLSLIRATAVLPGALYRHGHVQKFMLRKCLGGG